MCQAYFTRGEPEGTRPLVRLRRRKTGDIKRDIKGMGYQVVDWTDVAQDGVQ
jgi:hypothetical protein